jgi:hypothetical protein
MEIFRTNNMNPQFTPQQLQKINSITGGNLTSDSFTPPTPTQTASQNWANQISQIAKQGSVIAPTPAQPTSALPPTTAYGKATDVLQDVGNAAGAANNALTGNTGTIADYINPISWVTHVIGGAANVLSGGLNATVNPLVENLASMAGTAIRNAVGAKNIDSVVGEIKNVVNSPLGQSLIKTYTAPDVVSDLNAVKNIAGTAGIVTGAGQVAESMGEVPNAFNSASPIPRAVNAVGTTVGNVVPSSIKNAVIGAPATEEGVAAQILQPTASEISNMPTATKGLTSIDTTGVKNYSDLGDRIDEAIKTEKASVDTTLGQNNGLYKPEDIVKTVPVSGNVPATDETGAPIMNKDGTPQMTSAPSLTTDPVSDGLHQLQQFYDKTGDTTNLARVNGLINDYENGDGLSLQQLNNIAREHGTELTGYNVNGDPALGPTKQAYENTRTGIKSVVRDLNGPDDTTAASDQKIHQLIKAKDMVDDMVNKVKVLESKLQNYSLLQRFGRFGAKAFNLFTGGVVKGFLQSIQGMGPMQGVTSEGSLMDTAQLQKALAGNLTLLNQLNGMSDAQAVSTLSNIVSSAPISSSQSVLPAVGVSSQDQHQKTTKSHQKLSKGIK